MLQPFKVRIGLNTRIRYSPEGLIKGYFSGSLPFAQDVPEDLAHAFGYLHPTYRRLVIDDFYFQNWSEKDHRAILLRYFFTTLDSTDTDPNEIYKKFLFYEMALGNSQVLNPVVHKIFNTRTIGKGIRNAVGIQLNWDHVIDRIGEMYFGIDKSNPHSGKVYSRIKLDKIETMIAEIIYAIRTSPTTVIDDYLYEKTVQVLASFDENYLTYENESLIRLYFKFLLRMNYLRSAAILTNLANLSYSTAKVYSPVRIYFFEQVFDAAYLQCCRSELAVELVKEYLEYKIYEANLLHGRFIFGMDTGVPFSSLNEAVFRDRRIPENLIYQVTPTSKYLNEILPFLFTSPPASADIATFQNKNNYYSLPILAFALDCLHRQFKEVPSNIRNHIFKRNPKELNSNQGDLLRSHGCFFLMLYADFVEFTDGNSLELAIANKTMVFLSETSTKEFLLLDAMMRSPIISQHIKTTIQPLHSHLQSRYTPVEPTLLEYALIAYLVA